METYTKIYTYIFFIIFLIILIIYIITKQTTFDEYKKIGQKFPSMENKSTIFVDFNKELYSSTGKKLNEVKTYEDINDFYKKEQFCNNKSPLEDRTILLNDNSTHQIFIRLDDLYDYQFSILEKNNDWLNFVCGPLLLLESLYSLSKNIQLPCECMIKLINESSPFMFIQPKIINETQEKAQITDKLLLFHKNGIFSNVNQEETRIIPTGIVLEFFEWNNKDFKQSLFVRKQKKFNGVDVNTILRALMFMHDSNT